MNEPQHNPGQVTPKREQPSNFDIFLCDGGPMLVRGDAVIEDEFGVKHTTHRKLSAVCRCGLSAIKPWCDGSHKMVKK